MRGPRAQETVGPKKRKAQLAAAPSLISMQLMYITARGHPAS